MISSSFPVDYLRNPVVPLNGGEARELMMKETNADLELEALRLIVEGKMPTFEELVKVIAETREKYKPLILAARKVKDEDAE